MLYWITDDTTELGMCIDVHRFEKLRLLFRYRPATGTDHREAVPHHSQRHLASRVGHSPIDRKSPASDPGCFVGGEIENHFSYLFWFPCPTKRIMRQNGVQQFSIAHQWSGHRRIDESGVDHVAANALLGIVNCQSSGYGIERTFGGGIGRQCRKPN